MFLKRWLEKTVVQKTKHALDALSKLVLDTEA
jgi:hypothetical protein